MNRNENNIQNYGYICVVILIFIGVFLRFLDLPGQSLLWDEGTTIKYVEYDSFSALIRNLITENTSWSLQPAYYFILYLWLLVFEPSVTAMRALSAIFGGLSVIVLMFASWRTWGIKWMYLTGLFAAWSGYGIWYSQEIRPYSLSFFSVSIVLASYLCSKSAVGTLQIRTWRIFLAVSSMFCVWISVLNILFISFLAIFDFLLFKSFKPWIKLWAPAALASSTFAIWLVPHFILISGSQKFPTAGQHDSVFLNIGLIAYAIAVGETYGPPSADLRGSDIALRSANSINIAFDYWPHFVVLAITCLTIIVSILFILREKANFKEASLKLVFVLIATLISLYVFFAAGSAAEIIRVRPRHAFALWPLAALILPAVIYHQPQIHGRKRQLIGCTAVITLVLLNTYSVFNYFTDPKHGRDDYRSVAQYISENRDTLPILVHGVKRIFSFYTDRTVIDAQAFPPHAPPQFREIAGDWAKVVFIINRPLNREFDSKTNLAQSLGPDFELVDEIYPHYFVMYVFKRVHKSEQ